MSRLVMRSISPWDTERLNASVWRDGGEVLRSRQKKPGLGERSRARGIIYFHVLSERRSKVVTHTNAGVEHKSIITDGVPRLCVELLIEAEIWREGKTVNG